jgi:polyisoprenoid-binding protein YceI
MTAPRPTPRRWPVLAVAAIGAVAVIAAGGLWYLFLQPAGPAPVSLGTAVPATAPAATAAAETAGPSAGTGGGEATTAPATAQAGQDGDGIGGTWTVDPSIGSFSDFSGSFVGYRVKETLANIGATEAVGRTPDVRGSFTLDGTTITAATFTADLTTLQSDKQFRDEQLRRQALETSRFPEARFTLTAPVDLGALPADGAIVDVTVTGDLALHGVTRQVEIPLRARLADGVVTVAGSIPIAFSDFGIAKPQSMMVLSVEDNGVMEVSLQLTRG